MFLNKPVVEPLNNSFSKGLDYDGLIRFLVEPFLDSPDELKLDFEISASKPRIWVRLAIETADKGRVYGRGGRNIQAIKTVVAAAGQAVGQSVYLDVYGGYAPPSERYDEPSRGGSGGRSSPSRPPARRPSRSRSSYDSRSRSR
ncbi:MAG: KH domain-containing protein [Desertifilum sp. SIO1I2]|nr:KH domain-containing protein [Desertifilum sp. SIO1I2]